MAFVHDFRTPITALQGFAELMREAPEHRRDEFLMRIQDNAQRLGEMMEDLVHHLRTPAATVLVELTPVDIPALIEGTLASLGSVLNAGRIELSTPQESVFALAERRSLQRVLSNLLDNALKYSEDQVVVQVRKAPQATLISITDTGRGIDPEDLPRIFDELERGRLADNDGGTGLGLSSAKHLAKRQGDSIRITSTLGVGTTVDLALRTHELTRETDLGQQHPEHTDAHRQPSSFSDGL